MNSFQKISIVIPTYNQDKYIEETLLSVISQNYPNLELIVIDGGSADDTLQIIEKYDENISYWVSEPDSGQTHALIKGFNLATGDIYSWLCSDDLHEPNTLMAVADYFISHPQEKVVFGDCSWIDVHGKPIRPFREIPFNQFIWLHTHNYIPQPSTFWKASLYHEVGGLDLNFNYAMDADLWIRFAQEASIKHVNAFWSRFRQYPEQKNQAHREMSNREDERIRERYIGNQPNFIRILLSIIAKTIRVFWKFFSGKYIWGENKPNFIQPPPR